MMVWIDPGNAWWSAVDAAARIPDDNVVLLLVTPLDDEPAGAVPDGPGGSPEDRAAALFDEAEARLGRPVHRLWERGRAEREVVSAAHDVELLVVVRDPVAEPAGSAVRHVVDHAPCAVLLVWPYERAVSGLLPPDPLPPVGPLPFDPLP